MMMALNRDLLEAVEPEEATDALSAGGNFVIGVRSEKGFEIIGIEFDPVVVDYDCYWCLLPTHCDGHVYAPTRPDLTLVHCLRRMDGIAYGFE